MRVPVSFAKGFFDRRHWKSPATRINGIEISIVLGRPFEASPSLDPRESGVCVDACVCAPFCRVFPLPAPLERSFTAVQRYKNSLFPPPASPPLPPLDPATKRNEKEIFVDRVKLASFFSTSLFFFRFSSPPPPPLPLSLSPSLLFFFISKRCLHETRRVFEGNVFGQPSEKLR